MKDEPAFPDVTLRTKMLENIANSKGVKTEDLAATRGLTKREYFAGLAMQGILAKYGPEGASSCAKYSVEYADALLEELEK